MLKIKKTEKKMRAMLIDLKAAFNRGEKNKCMRRKQVREKLANHIRMERENEINFKQYM